MRHFTPKLLMAGLLAVSLAEGALAQWVQPNGEPLPFSSDEEILRFLREAEVEKVKVITSGTNRPVKVLLKKDGIEAHAVFRTVEVRKNTFKDRDEIYVDFRDHYIFECAAYEMSRLLGLHNVPPCVERKLWGGYGSLQLWVENAMMEEKRRKKGLAPPRPQEWARQRAAMLVFDALIRNLDRNQGNILIDADWNVWLIDHTRSFHKSPELPKVDKLKRCEESLWTSLRRLDRPTLDERLGPYLTDGEITAVMERRDALVAHFEERFASLGRELVLYPETVTASVSP